MSNGGWRQSFAADVAGYSRLMTLDEEGTHFRLLSYRREVIEPKVREHRAGSSNIPVTARSPNSVASSMGCAAPWRCSS
jgi:hypothetical protein